MKPEVKSSKDGAAVPRPTVRRLPARASHKPLRVETQRAPTTAPSSALWPHAHDAAGLRRSSSKKPYHARRLRAPERAGNELAKAGCSIRDPSRGVCARSARLRLGSSRHRARGVGRRRCGWIEHHEWLEPLQTLRTDTTHSQELRDATKLLEARAELDDGLGFAWPNAGETSQFVLRGDVEDHATVGGDATGRRGRRRSTRWRRRGRRRRGRPRNARRELRSRHGVGLSGLRLLAARTCSRQSSGRGRRGDGRHVGGGHPFTADRRDCDARPRVE